VSQSTPVSAQSKSLFGYMKNTMKITGDVVAPTGEIWSAVSGAEDHFYGAVGKKQPARLGRLKK
jgi:hypothetical protein